MKIKKKIVGASLGTLFALGSAASVFAAQPATSATPSHHWNHSQYEAKLSQEAKTQGISVDQLKAKFKADHEAKLEQEAKAKGISVDQLKAQLKAKGEAKLEQMAKKKGLTVDQLKAQWQAKHAANSVESQPQS